MLLSLILLLQSSRPLQAPADVEIARQDRAIVGCVFKQGSTTSHLLSSLPGSAEATRVIKVIASKIPSCQDNGSWVIVRDAALREGIAENLLLGVGNFRATPFTMPSLEVRAKMPGRQQAELALIVAGECVGNADPATANTFAATKVGTADEMASFIGLSKMLARCGLPTEPSRLRMLRDYITEGTYRAAFTRSEMK